MILQTEDTLDNPSPKSYAIALSFFYINSESSVYSRGNVVAYEVEKTNLYKLIIITTNSVDCLKKDNKLSYEFKI